MTGHNANPTRNSTNTSSIDTIKNGGKVRHRYHTRPHDRTKKDSKDADDLEKNPQNTTNTSQISTSFREATNESGAQIHGLNAKTSQMASKHVQDIPGAIDAKADTNVSETLSLDEVRRRRLQFLQSSDYRFQQNTNTKMKKKGTKGGTGTGTGTGRRLQWTSTL